MSRRAAWCRIDGCVRAAIAAITLVAAATLIGCGSTGDDPPPPQAGGGAGQPPGATATSDDAGVLRFTMQRLDGTPESLRRYQGRVVLVVNTASECGYAPQFGGLERLYRERRRSGFVVLGFPADDVVGQEPRSNEQIAEFCRANFGVSFPMFAKINVTGDAAAPLFKALGEPDYNFNKYLLDRRGRLVGRWGATTEPDDPELVAAIAAELRRG